MSYPLVDALAGTALSVNGQIYSLDSDQARLLEEPTDQLMYYEVIRISQQTPLFWYDHLARFKKSVGRQFPFPENLLADSLALLRQQLASGSLPQEVNLRIVLTPELAVQHLIPSYYPDRAAFKQGVPTLILDWERENPNIKLINPAYKQAVKEGFDRQGPYGQPFELILADRRGNFTEGSRTNLFFIDGQRVLSAPEETVLAGITRKYVIEAISQAGYQLEYGMINKTDLKSYQGASAFLSGSPIDLVPISSIEDQQLSSADNKVFGEIAEAYQAILAKWLADNRHLQA